jgi:hypothetical protein
MLLEMTEMLRTRGHVRGLFGVTMRSNRSDEPVTAASSSVTDLLVIVLLIGAWMMRG